MSVTVNNNCCRYVVTWYIYLPDHAKFSFIYLNLSPQARESTRIASRSRHKISSELGAAKNFEQFFVPRIILAMICFIRCGLLFFPPRKIIKTHSKLIVLKFFVCTCVSYWTYTIENNIVILYTYTDLMVLIR